MVWPIDEEGSALCATILVGGVLAWSIAGQANAKASARQDFLSVFCITKGCLGELLSETLFNALSYNQACNLQNNSTR